MGLNRVGYNQLKQAAAAERKGEDIDLNIDPPAKWTLLNQVEQMKERRKANFIAKEAVLRGKSTAQLAGKSKGATEMKYYNTGSRPSGLSTYNNRGKGASSALQKLSLTKEGLATLPKTRT